jgi:hypothetical protein
VELSEFTADNLRPHVGSEFHLTFDDGRSIDLTLTEVLVRLEKHHTPRMKRDSFSLFFLGPAGAYMPQGSYATTHEVLGGPWSIFYVPVGRKESGSFEFEAVFT